jgi:hypothetical protein
MSTIKLADGTEIEEVIAVAKSLIQPEDLRNGGVLTPQGASRLISMLYADPFLKQVTTERMSRLTKNVDVLDIMRRQLVRVAQGNEPDDSDLTGAAEFGCKLTALDVQLFASLTLDFLRDNKDNPNLQKEVETGFNTRLGNDLVDLAFNGVADDAVGADRAAKFIRLNKGWLQIMREADNTPKVDIDPATDGWKASLKSIMEAGDIRFRKTSVFLMNTADADDYAEELNAPITGMALDADSPLRRYKGKPIVDHPEMPQGSVAFTPLKNLVVGLHTDIQRNRAYHNRRRALEYTFDMAVDFEVAVKQAAVLGE